MQQEKLADTSIIPMNQNTNFHDKYLHKLFFFNFNKQFVVDISVCFHTRSRITSLGMGLWAYPLYPFGSSCGNTRVELLSEVWDSVSKNPCLLFTFVATLIEVQDFLMY